MGPMEETWGYVEIENQPYYYKIGEYHTLVLTEHYRRKTNGNITQKDFKIPQRHLHIADAIICVSNNKEVQILKHIDLHLKEKLEDSDLELYGLTQDFIDRLVKADGHLDIIDL